MPQPHACESSRGRRPWGCSHLEGRGGGQKRIQGGRVAKRPRQQEAGQLAPQQRRAALQHNKLPIHAQDCDLVARAAVNCPACHAGRSVLELVFEYYLQAKMSGAGLGVPLHSQTRQIKAAFNFSVLA